MNKSLLLTAIIALMSLPAMVNAQTSNRSTNNNVAAAQTETANAASTNVGSTGTAYSTDASGNSSNAQVSFYPNPFHSTLNVSIGNSSQNAGSKLIIYSPEGVVLMQTILTQMVNSYPMNNFAPGVYYYRVIRVNGAVQSGKIIAKRQY